MNLRRYRALYIGVTFAYFFVIGITGCAHGKIRDGKPLVNPFVDLAKIERPNKSQTASCPSPPSPVIDVMSQTYYKDSHHSIIDAERLERSREMVQPLRVFNSQVAHFADRLWKFDDPDAESCLLNWLGTWANAGALLGEANYQGEFERKWNLSGLALTYLKIEPLVRWTPEEKSIVLNWLEKIAKRVRLDYDQKLDRQSRRNNHIYWAGLSVMATAIATGDNELYEWGLSKARKGITDVTPEGFLPEELDRASRARHYQSFALQALTMMAFLSEKNGTDLYSINEYALHRLAKKTIEGYEDDSVFRQVTSVQQEPIDPRDFAWTFAYLFRNPNGLDLQSFESDSYNYSPWLGGDLAATFSAQR